MKYLLDWKVGFCDNLNMRPNNYFSATVPGAVQLDYTKEYGLPDYRRGMNFKDYKWMEDKFWVYTAEFDASTVLNANNLFIVTNGIDYQYEIYVNGNMVCAYEGMYRKHILNISNYIGNKIQLEIVVYPVPKSTLSGVLKDTRNEANQCCKPAVSYGWDFHPRLVPLGIWDEIYILETPLKRIAEPCVSYELSSDLSSAEISLEIDGVPNAKWELYDPNDKLVFDGVGEKLKFTLENIHLWWCNGYGNPHLYRYVVYGDGIGKIKEKIGFKKIRLVKSEGSWDEGLKYPMTRNTPPITVELNNTIIFAKGTNWVSPEIFYGTLDYGRYREQLEMVKEANFNFIRMWGGSLINKEDFFKICDELGILVWQEFPLACNNYYATKHYIEVLENEVSAIIDRVKKHVCLMMWCGGNELFNNWSHMTDQDAAIRLMNKLTYEKTPEIPYISTAPMMGMAHGPYNFNMNDGREIIEVIANCRNTAYTEFGGAGYSNLETLLLIGDLEDLWPLNTTNELAVAHSAQWNCDKQIKRYFGKSNSIDELIKYGQLLQSVGQSFVFEEARRQKPYCSMASNWCFNEPWPNTGNNSLLSYPNYKKDAYYAVAKSCRSVLASARYRKFLYFAYEELDFDVFLLNDSLEKVENGRVNVYVQIGKQDKQLVFKWEYSDVDISTNIIGPTVSYNLPYVEDADTLKIILECGEYSSEYTLLYRSDKTN